jgi:hypothetical protein
MNLRPALFAAATLATALGICLALYHWGARGNHNLAALAGAFQQGEELAPHIEAGRRRDEAKRTLAAEVVAGRLTLHEAAEQYRHLDEADPSYPPDVPRPSGYEWTFCDRVLDYVWVVLAHQQQYATAARWYAEVFTAHPHVLAGTPIGHRYYAARAAVLASCGQGRDAAYLDEASRASFRRQARDWLRDELEAQRRLLETDPEKTRWMIAGGLNRWLWDLDFAGVRGPDALSRLPEAERQAWQTLWTDVADTQARAEGTAPPEQQTGSEQ